VAQPWRRAARALFASSRARLAPGLATRLAVAASLDARDDRRQLGLVGVVVHLRQHRGVLRHGVGELRDDAARGRAVVAAAVAAPHLDVRDVLLQLHVVGVHRLALHVDEADMRALPREGAHDRGADARAAPGDEDPHVRPRSRSRNERRAGGTTSAVASW
jgi:hypothetical protein